MFYAAFDVLAARGTLYTVNLLGMAVFKGLRDPSVLRCRSPPISRRSPGTVGFTSCSRWPSG